MRAQCRSRPGSQATDEPTSVFSRHRARSQPDPSHRTRLGARGELGVSHSTAARAWAEHDVKPWPTETIKFSTDPELDAKVRDVVGLYLPASTRARDCALRDGGRQPWLVSGEDDELACGPSVLHVGMRLGDLVEGVGAVDRDGEAAGRDRVEVALEDVGG
jgi:hypothetical protein